MPATFERFKVKTGQPRSECVALLETCAALFGTVCSVYLDGLFSPKSAFSASRRASSLSMSL